MSIAAISAKSSASRWKSNTCAFFDNAVLLHGLRDYDIPHVQMPANEHLRAGLAVLFRNFSDFRTVDEQEIRAAQGAPRLNADAAFLAVRLQLAFLEGRVQLDLVDGRKRQALGLQLLQVTNLEV